MWGTRPTLKFKDQNENLNIVEGWKIESLFYYCNCTEIRPSQYEFAGKVLIVYNL